MRILKRSPVSGFICGTAALLLLGGVVPGLSAEDLDVGSEAATGYTCDPLSYSDWYNFGGTSQSFSGSNRGRGNTFTFTENEKLIEFTVWLDFTGDATIYFYVLESSTLNGTYTPIYEGIEPTSSTGAGYYSSGTIDVDLTAGMYYGIGVAWGPETIYYFRDAATLPRTWDLGTVEDSMQISAAPPYTGLTYNHFAGSEYCMQLYIYASTPVASSTWGEIKSFF